MTREEKIFLHHELKTALALRLSVANRLLREHGQDGVPIDLVKLEPLLRKVRDRTLAEGLRKLADDALRPLAEWTKEGIEFTRWINGDRHEPTTDWAVVCAVFHAFRSDRQAPSEAVESWYLQYRSDKPGWRVSVSYTRWAGLCGSEYYVDDDAVEAADWPALVMLASRSDCGFAIV